MSDDVKAMSSHDDGVKKRKGCAPHCKRFWWAYLIASIAIVLLVVLLM
jgi:hypothetical protein